MPGLQKNFSFSPLDVSDEHGMSRDVRNVDVTFETNTGAHRICTRCFTTSVWKSHISPLLAGRLQSKHTFASTDCRDQTWT